MKIRMWILVMFVNCYCNSQINASIYYKKIDHGFEVLATNAMPCPITVILEIKKENLARSDDNEVFVVPAKKDSIVLTTFEQVDKMKEYSFTFRYITYLGDSSEDKYDSSFNYYLPFERKKMFEVSQGYNGDFSHQSKNAIDFKMPVGTKICAAREGVVVKVVDKNNTACPLKECESFNNQIVIYHDDGTFADYAHIKFKSAKVGVGDYVESGQIIAESGNVGYTSGPHLHFMVYQQKFDKHVSIPTKFRTGKNGEKLIELKEGSRYMRRYD